MHLAHWIAGRGGIVHRTEVLDAGYGLAELRREMKAAGNQVIRRAWIALPTAPLDLVDAARAGGRVACVSVAMRRGWWMPEGVDPRLHVRMAPDAGPARMPSDWAGVLHWTQSIAPAPRHALVESPEDALAHIAKCLPYEDALVVWESAMRMESLSPEVVRGIAWTTPEARRCAADVTGLSDSGLETIFAVRVRRQGLSVRQQVVLAGRRVDALIGDRLVVQIDGYEFHSSPAQRAKDIAHDAELRLRGYTVLRFSYAQILHDWTHVERVIRRSVASRLHPAAA